MGLARGLLPKGGGPPIAPEGGGCNRAGKGLLAPEVSPPGDPWCMEAGPPELGGINSRIPFILNCFRVLGSRPRLLRSDANCDMLPVLLKLPPLPLFMYVANFEPCKLEIDYSGLSGVPLFSTVPEWRMRVHFVVNGIIFH